MGVYSEDITKSQLVTDIKYTIMKHKILIAAIVLQSLNMIVIDYSDLYRMINLIVFVMMFALLSKTDLYKKIIDKL